VPTDPQTDEAGASAATKNAPASPTEPAKLLAPLRPGERVGRFIVLEPLGHGGMGLVWSAFDPKLDRKVALKFLRAGSDGEGGQARLLREAQALARLSHPNVVAVHDVDTHKDRVFVAMELVVGDTLKDWIRTPRSWREVLRALLEAGRGLAAAHRAGIVHRDVKPTNVLVGTDGRARVSDFGLARALEERPTASAGAPVAEPALEESVTEQGYVVGTREYMSPEQAAGHPVDARSDVFSFCVTAYEALCGVRPSALSAYVAPGPRTGPWAATSAQLARLPAPLAGRHPPGRLLRRLARGLQSDPAQRWPSMPALLDALERDARPWRSWHLALIGALAVASASAAAVRLGQDPCAAGAEQIASVWSAGGRAWLQPAFAEAAPDQPGAADRAARFLDAYAERWQAAYRDACQATREGTQAPELGALRMACLEARRQAAAAVVTLLRRADATTVRQSADAVLGLPGVSGCSELEALAAPLAPPDDGPVRQQIDRLRQQLATVQAEIAMVDRRARADAEALVAEADRVGYAPLQAEAWLTLANLMERHGEAAAARDGLVRALVAAERGRDESSRARATSLLAFVLGHHFTLWEEADRWLEQADAILDRTPQADVEAQARYITAQLRIHQGRLPEALESLDAMRSLIRQNLLDKRIRAAYLQCRSQVLFELGRMAESEQAIREAVALSVEIRGERHPFTVRMRYLLAGVLVEVGKTVEAREHADGADRYWNDPGTANARYSLDAGDVRATSYLMEGRYREALAEARRIQALREKAGDQANLSFTLDNLGAALLGLGRPGEAIAPLERSQALKVQAGRRAVTTSEGMLMLAKALWLGGEDRDRARVLAREVERVTRIAPDGRVHREALAWLAAHP